MGYASQQEDDEKRRQEAYSGIDEYHTQATSNREPNDLLPWRWVVEFRGQVIARIMETCHRGGWGIAGTIVASPEFERFRPYCKDLHTHTWSESSRDTTHDSLFREINRRGGLHIRDL